MDKEKLQSHIQEIEELRDNIKYFSSQDRYHSYMLSTINRDAAYKIRSIDKINDSHFYIKDMVLDDLDYQDEKKYDLLDERRKSGSGRNIFRSEQKKLVSNLTLYLKQMKSLIKKL